MAVGRRTALVTMTGALAGLLVLSACSNHAHITRHAAPPGFDDSTLPLPTPPFSIGGTATPSPSRGKRVSHSPSPSATPTPSASPSTSTGAGVDREPASSSGAPRPRTSSAHSTRPTSRPPSSSSRPPSGPQLVVSPGSGLSGGQHVQLQISGFPGHAQIQIRECLNGRCSVLQSKYAHTDGTGALSRDYPVSSTVNGHRCHSLCVIAVDALGAAGQASAPISFA